MTVTAVYYHRLDGIEHYISLLDRLKRLGAAPDASSVTRTLVGRAALETRTGLLERLDWETISLDGCVLSLAAQFELTVRDLVESFINSIAAKSPTYTHLPARIREYNVRSVGELLSDFDAPRLAHLNYVDAVSQLAACTSNGTPVVLFASGFSMTRANLRAKELTNVLARLEIKELWPRLSANRWLQGHLGVAGLAAAQTAAMVKLDQFMEYRNQIAHRGPSYTTLGPAIILDYIAFFRVLMGALSSIVWEELSKVS